MADVVRFPATLDDVAPPDAEARKRALDIQRSFIVDAPAGSGKTGLLIQRYLKLLADESITSPEQVLAITFTNKATVELRERVLAQLSFAQDDSALPTISDFARETRALARAVLDRDRQYGWSLLEHPHRLHLRTIDSVCVEIARTLPILSGSGGHLKPATDAEPLHREAARRTILLLGSGDIVFDNSLRDLLVHRDGNLAECESLLTDMLSLRDQWGRLIPLARRDLEDVWLDANVLPRLELALDHAISADLARLERLFPPDLLVELTALAADFGNCKGYGGNPSPLAMCASLHKPPEAVSAHLGEWRALLHFLLTSANDWRKERGITGRNMEFDYDRKHPRHSRLTLIIEQLTGNDDLLAALRSVRLLPSSTYPAEQWRVAKSLFRVLSRALVELQIVFAKHGECDFTELSLLASHALQQDSGAEDLAAALGARLQHLLIDEMQDTSTSQYELIERLTASWDGHSQTVFLVGDPRQSIYLFRQARFERFLLALHTQKLGELPLTCLRLTANFRSQLTLIEQFNQDFSLIFPKSAEAANDAEALPYTPAQPTLPASHEASGVVWHTHVLTTPDPQTSPARSAANVRQRQASKDANEILRIAREWFARPLPPHRVKPWSIAVLVRSRKHLGEIVSALRQQDDPLPFKAVEIEALNERQEILDLTALTRALLHPADRVAGLAVLRAPWCGLSLADLYLLSGGDNASLRHQSIPRIMAERGHLLPDEACQRMTRVWNVLQHAAAKRAVLTAAQLVESAWRSLGGDAWLTQAELANARRYFQLLDELEASGSRIDPELLNMRLRCLYAEPDMIPSGNGYLELMTIHKAKGLEWDVVFIPALERSVSGNRSRLLTWSEIDASDSRKDTAAHVMLAPIPGRGEESQALSTWLNSIHRTREAAETKRLFYVACTRAREELHLFASLQHDAKLELHPPAKSLIEAAWAAAEPQFTTASDLQTIGAEPLTRGLEYKQTAVTDYNSLVFDIAAAARSSGPVLQRIPQEFDPAVRFADAAAHKLPCSVPDIAVTFKHAQFSRPEGSFAARSFGNAVHACLDMLASRIRKGDSPSVLLAELPSWRHRISVLLRSDGLSRVNADRLTQNAHNALENVLRDPVGLWVLAPHIRADSEFALTSTSGGGLQSVNATSRAATIRVDRIFEAGSEPGSTGEDFLWIIDYKTTPPGTGDLSKFLNAQRVIYGPQLEAYAHILVPARNKLPRDARLALYFPGIPRLTWWPLESEI